MSATRKSTRKAADKVEQFNERATESMKENLEKMTAGMADMGEFGKDNFEAVVESATTYAKGVEELASEQASFTKDAMERGVEQMKAVSSVKTPQEFFQLQSDFFRSMVEANINQVTKVSDMMVAMGKDASEPLNKRYSAMVEKAQSFSN